MQTLKRSIPACTGEPTGREDVYFPRGVYPRVYGGTVLSLASEGYGRGLSPRVRGNLARHLEVVDRVRSIPACTGEPPMLLFCGASLWVYPRVYGGTAPMSNAWGPPTGLSPRVRGNRHTMRAKLQRLGSIPACTGEPENIFLSQDDDGVYPRVYGGTRPCKEIQVASGGLSPRVRGNHPCRSVSRFHHGSIPACTGEPKSCTTGRREHRVYPRVYGGTGCTCVSSPSRSGSIPACTGEPRVFLASKGYGGVYPRVYGGTSMAFDAAWRCRGLSPRVRGNQ